MWAGVSDGLSEEGRGSGKGSGLRSEHFDR